MIIFIELYLFVTSLKQQQLATRSTGLPSTTSRPCSDATSVTSFCMAWCARACSVEVSSRPT